jgi:DNA polymerase III, beta subunit
MPHALVKIPAVVLESLIAKTKFAISMEESRYTLNGGLLILKPDTIAMVATDGHRLALAETTQKLAGLNGEVKVLIPKKAMDEVEKLSSTAGSDAQLDFAKDESHLFFQAGHRLLISRILTGQFPNYEAVLPRDNNKTVVIERGELCDAVRRVSQLADQRSHAVKLAVSTEGIEISASSPEYGEAKENIEKEYAGDPIAIGFNSSYMLDFLGAAADGPISIELKDEQSAGQMRPLPTNPIATATSSCPCASDRRFLSTNVRTLGPENLQNGCPFHVLEINRVSSFDPTVTDCHKKA